MGTESERTVDQYDKTSPWPIVVVFGLVLSEIGVLFGIYPVAVGGLAMFVGSVSGIVNEAGYVASPWRLLSGLGAALFVAGTLVLSTQGDVTSIGTFLTATGGNAIELRAVTLAGPGAVLAVIGLLAPLLRKN